MEYKENIRKMLPDELAACIEESTIHMSDPTLSELKAKYWMFLYLLILKFYLRHNKV